MKKSKFNLSNQNIDLLEKNNSIKTGYENFCIKKGTVKLLPFKDFDFIGKHVVCQKCCQKFASKMSYRAHVSTNICVRTYNGPNLVYLKYKNRNIKQKWKKNKTKSVEDIHAHDIKKNLLNPEMLNTLQTRNNCYSDIVYQRNKVKEKPINSSNKNDEPFVKKPRGRPRKNVDIEPKRRGRPKKPNSVIVDVDSSSQDDNNLNNTESDEAKLKGPRIVSVCSVDDEFNNNVNETQKLEFFSSKMKILTDRFWKLVNTVWTQVKDTDGLQNSSKNHEQILYNKEEEKDKLAVKESEIFQNIEILENDLKFLFKQCKDKNEYSYTEELQLMLSKLNEKRNEYNQSKLKKTEMNNGTTTDKGKENIQCALRKNEDEIEKNTNKKETRVVETWLNNDKMDTVSPSMSVISNDNCESNNCIDVINLNDDSTSLDSFEKNTKTYTEEVTMNCMSSIKNHLNKLDVNYLYGSTLVCKMCNKHFESVVEMKMHRFEHLNMANKKLLCKICGLKFKEFKNFVKHVNQHGKSERNSTHFKKNSTILKCKICNKQFDLLVSYYSHIKTHK